jgi:Immunity protein Imm1
MYAAMLSTDFWQGVRCDASDIAHPSPEDIEAAIKALDGMHRTTVNDDAHLAVGGGTGGQYVVYATFDNARFFMLMSSEQSECKVLLFIGGQEGDYPKSIVVDLPLALAAAKSFAETGQIDMALQWRSHRAVPLPRP